MKMSVEERIDVHAHFLPPFYRAACLETGNGKPDGMPVLPVCLTLTSRIGHDVKDANIKIGVERRKASGLDARQFNHQINH
jgi:hypothetical protein